MSFPNWLSRRFRTDTATNSAPDAKKLRDARIDRREQLYGVMRTALVRAGVQTTSFKFKVLALDDQGQQFLVMVDIASSWGGDAGWRSHIETQVVQAAQSQHGLVITAVYWRNNADLASVPSSMPATLWGPDAGPSDRVTLAGGVGRYEPLQDDEVAAFQKALAVASRPPSVSGKID